MDAPLSSLTCLQQVLYLCMNWANLVTTGYIIISVASCSVSIHWARYMLATCTYMYIIHDSVISHCLVIKVFMGIVTGMYQRGIGDRRVGE